MFRNISEKLKNIKNTIILLWIFSYIIVFSIPTISNIFIYTKAIKSTRAETEQLYNRFLNELIISVDNILELCDHFHVNLATNSKVKSLLVGTDSKEHIAEHSINLSGDMRRQLIYSDFSDMYIQFNNLDLVVSSSYSNNSKEFFEYFYRESDLNYDKWYKSMNTQNYGNYMLVKKKTGNFIDFMYQIPSYEEHYVNATLVIRVSEEVFRNKIYMLENYDKTNIVILDSDNQTIFQNNPSENILPEPYDSYGSFGGIIEHKTNVTVYQTSKTNKWKFISLTPQVIFWSKLKYVRNINLAFILIAAVISGILASYFSIKNYKPIQGLVQACKNVFGSSSADKGAYDFINAVIIDYIDSKKSIRTMEYEKLNNTSNMYFSKLLKSTVPSAAMELPPNELNVKFISDMFSVIIFNVQNAEKLFTLKNELEEDESDNIIFFVIQNVIEELFNADDKCYINKTDNQIVGVLNYKNTQSAEIYKVKIQKIISEGKIFIEKNFNFTFSVGVSSIRQGIDNLSIAYNEAVCALNLKKHINDGKIVFYNEIYHNKINNFKNEFFMTFTEKERSLKTKIATGDYKSAKCMVEGILEQCASNLDIEMLRIFMFNLANTILQTMKLSENARSEEIIKEVNNAMNFNNMSEFHRTIFSLLDQACNLNKESISNTAPVSNEQSDGIISQIIDYIRENYKDNSMNISRVGDYFNMSPYYISKIFKKATGKEMLEYIGRLRIEKAKELIETSSLSMNEIFEEVGFNNEKTFVRTFKKHESITPYNYKEIYSANNTQLA